MMQTDILNKLQNEVTINIPGIGDITAYGWLFACIILALVLILVILCVTIRILLGKSAPKRQKTKVERKKAEKEARKEKAHKKIAVTSESAHMQKVIAEAPPLTAYTEAEYPAGIDPLEFAARTDGTQAEKDERRKAYVAWCEEQAALYEKQLAARKDYFEANNYGYEGLVDKDVLKASEQGLDDLTPAEKKANARIEKENAKRIAKALKLKEKEEKNGGKKS